MIKTRTTFVVGAGASKPYGLPLGSDLHGEARNLETGSNVYRLLIASGIQADQLNEFLSDLRNHPAQSVDAFLETRQKSEITLRIGRAIIAAIMGRALTVRHAVQANHEWLGYVINQMWAGAPTWQDFAAGNSGVRFVTFNFDSIIETRLRHEITRIYQTTQEEAEEAVKDILVCHVHGQLPPIPIRPDGHAWGFIRNPPHDDVQPEWLEWMGRAAPSINVVLDSIREETLSVARESIRTATIVCCLGFSYHRDNLARLDIPGSIKGGSQIVFGSAMGCPDGVQEWIRGRFNSLIKLGHTNENCLEVLKKFYIFRD